MFDAKKQHRSLRSALAAIAAAALLPSAALADAGEKAGETKKGASAKSAIPTRPVTAIDVTTGSVVETVEVIGELQGIEEIRVFAMIPERIRSLTVDEGHTVKKGDVLATLMGDLQTEAVNQAQAALEAAVANRDAIKDNLERTRALVKVGSATQSQLDGLEAQYRAAEAQVRQATAGLGSAGAQRDRIIVRSPISGVVAQVNLRAGDYAAGGVPIMTVLKPDRLKAVLRVPERDFLRVKQGMKVVVSPLAVPQQKVEATVTLKGPIVDRTTRTGLVEIHLDNSDGALVPGSAIKATIELARRDGVVLVPAEAVLLTTETERTGAAISFVITEGDKDEKGAQQWLARRRDVTIGIRQGADIEVKDGLKAGERLIVQGAHLLRDENPVTIVGGDKPQEQ